MTNGTATTNYGILTLTHNGNMQVDKDGTRDSAVGGRARLEFSTGDLRDAKYAWRCERRTVIPEIRTSTRGINTLARGTCTLKREMREYIRRKISTPRRENCFVGTRNEW